MLQIMIAILQVHHDPISNKFCGSGNRLRPSTIGFSYSSICFIAVVSLSSNTCRRLYAKRTSNCCVLFYRFSPDESTSQSRLQSLCSYCSHFWTDTYPRYFIQHPYNDPRPLLIGIKFSYRSNSNSY
jgi:hypothetical protein